MRDHIPLSMNTRRVLVRWKVLAPRRGSYTKALEDVYVDRSWGM